MHDKLVHQRMLYQACAQGKLENVKRLLWQRPREFDVANEFGISGVMIAASNGHQDVLDHLICLGKKLCRLSSASAVGRVIPVLCLAFFPFLSFSLRFPLFQFCPFLHLLSNSPIPCPLPIRLPLLSSPLLSSPQAPT
jgi:hypothetical protein